MDESATTNSRAGDRPNPKGSGGWLSPLVGTIPQGIRDKLLVQQAKRLHQSIPLLCMVIAANALAMTLAVLGDLPLWQQAAPPLIIVTVCLVALMRHHGKPATTDPDVAERQMKGAVLTAALLGPLAGLWCVNAFTEMEKYYCMTAPVFIGIAAVVSASCLQSVPRAALAAIVGTMMPIVTKLAFVDYMGIRAMAVMLVVVGIMQASVVTSKFRETVRTLSLQLELERLSLTDSLTGIGNRRAFMMALNDRLADGGSKTLLLLLDLDGFKAANDCHGHEVGDHILRGVAGRLTTVVPDAVSIARLGGDEFALLVDGDDAAVAPTALRQAIRDSIDVPFRLADGGVAWVGASIGMAQLSIDGDTDTELMRTADQRLYADKAKRKAGSFDRRAVA